MGDDGLIYQAERLVNWSPVLQTAISDIEVSHADVEGELVSFRYGSLDDTEPHIVVATTRLETMLRRHCGAVCTLTTNAMHLVGTGTAAPFLDQHPWIVADDYVDPGNSVRARSRSPRHTTPTTSALGMAQPADARSWTRPPDRRNWNAIRRHGPLRGAGRAGARRAGAHRQGGAAVPAQCRTHSRNAPVEPIEPRLSAVVGQVDSLAKTAGDAVRDGDTVIYPKSMEPRWFGWVDDMHDWCISRQLWWGTASRSGMARAARWSAPDPTNRHPGLHAETDVLDTWFSSGLWSFSTLGWPDNTADLEKSSIPLRFWSPGYDILFFWVARMMMFGTYVGKDLGR